MAVPVYETYSPAIGSTLIDEKGKEWTVTHEERWANLRVEHNPNTSGGPFCRFYALSDTYKGVSQLGESSRPKESRHFFGGVVGRKISTEHLRQMAPKGMTTILNAMKNVGVTTAQEFQAAQDKLLLAGDGNTGRTKENVPLTEEQLEGSTRHTILSSVSYLGDEKDKFEELLSTKPVYVGCKCARESMEKTLGKANGLVRRYKADEKDKSDVARHGVMAIGRGQCTDKAGAVLEYVVGQNNWPTQVASEICRFSYDALRITIGFDVGP